MTKTENKKSIQISKLAFLDESCNDFRYGKPTKRLSKAIAWLNSHSFDERRTKIFDYPDYWGMPKAVSYKLSTEEVDYIQEITHKLITK